MIRRLIAPVLTAAILAAATIPTAGAQAATASGPARIAQQTVDTGGGWQDLPGEHCVKVYPDPAGSLLRPVILEDVYPAWSDLTPRWERRGVANVGADGPWDVIVVGMPNENDQVWRIGLNGVTIAWSRMSSGEYRVVAEPGKAASCAPTYRVFLAPIGR